MTPALPFSRAPAEPPPPRPAKPSLSPTTLALTCPDCGSAAIPQSGCLVCPHCGWARCA